MREAIDAGTAVLGSCWGHQLIAVALAGLQAVRRAGAPEFGWLDIAVGKSGGILPEQGFQSFSAHFDEVVPECHPEMHVLASTPGCAVQTARWGNRRVWGIQPHPEIDPAGAKEFLEKCPDYWPDLHAMFRTALEGPVRDSGDGPSITQRFLVC